MNGEVTSTQFRFDTLLLAAGREPTYKNLERAEREKQVLIIFLSALRNCKTQNTG
jgi:hypothetical protein